MSKKPITVFDIAHVAGVSKSTVSLVLRNSTLVNESTRAKVNQTIRDLGYVYNRSAAKLRGAGSEVIGIVVNDLTNSFFAELAVGMDMVTQSAGFVQFLANTGESVDRQREVIASMREHGIAGLIVSPARGTTAADLKPLTDAGLHVVVVVRAVAGAKVSTLLSDNVGGVHAAVEHLTQLGHRRLAFLGGFADTAVFSERVRGYRNTLEAAGLKSDNDWIFPSAPSRAGGVAAVTAALARRERITAAVCLNDAVAFGACDGLRAQRLEPGKDFALVGFDDVIEAKAAVPALSTVSVDPQGMGRRAAQMLLKQINAERADTETIISATRLVVRDSSGGRIEAVEEAFA